MIRRFRRARRVGAPPQKPVPPSRRRPCVPCAPDAAGDRGRQAIEVGRTRLLIAGTVLALAFATVGFRLVDLALLQGAEEPRVAHAPRATTIQTDRANIVDRGGIILATSLRTASLYANPRRVLDPASAARRLITVMPQLDKVEITSKLKSKRSFVWLARNLTPRQQWEINRLGIPGLDFRREATRVYPHGSLAAHVVGFVDVDDRGLAGIEKTFDDALQRRHAPLELALDLRMQYVLCGELDKAKQEFHAIGAAGVVLDVRTGEIRAICSLPNFDPNRASRSSEDQRFNRAALGVYELGSVFKIFTVAMALDAGIVKLSDRYDATKPLKVSRFTIRDYHAKRRWLSVSEIFMYSSNIGAARMAIDVGAKTQRAFLGRVGLLDAAPIELPEVGTPMTPRVWRPVNTMTIGFGHGIAVSPIQFAAAAAAMVNGGIYHPPTLLKRDPAAATGKRVISKRTSNQMRRLMRLVVEHGTGGKAAATGYLVGGKTGTAEKQGNGGYRRRALLSSFLGAFPINDPRFVVLAVLDEPRGNAKTQGYATGGWIAAPVVGRVVRRIAPLVGINPIDEAAPGVRRDLAIDLKTEGRRLASF